MLHLINDQQPLCLIKKGVYRQYIMKIEVTDPLL